MAISVYDTFTDTEGTSLTSHSPNIGNAWILITESGYGLTIQGNKVAPDGVASGKYYNNVLALCTYIEGDYDISDHSYKLFLYLNLKLADISTDVYVVSIGGFEGNTIKLFYTDEFGDETEIGSYSSAPWSGHLKLEVLNNIAKVYLNGVVVIEVSSPSPTLEGYPAFELGYDVI